MKTRLALAAWIYLVAATLAETMIFYGGPGQYLTNLYIGLLAIVNVAVAGVFTMGLKDEPPIIHYLFLAPVMLVAVLILVMMFAYPPSWLS